MSSAGFASQVFDKWDYSNPEEGCYRWKRGDVTAEMTSWSDGWSVWIREDDSDLVFDKGFDKQDGFRFLRNQLRAVNLVKFGDESSFS
jgi:hypothetical protein